MVKIQRVKTYKGLDYIVGPAIHLKLTDKQLNQIIERENKTKTYKK